MSSILMLAPLMLCISLVLMWIVIIRPIIIGASLSTYRTADKILPIYMATTNCIVVSRPGYGYNSVRAGGDFLLFIMDVVKGIRATKYYKNMVNTCQYTYKPQRAAQRSMCLHRAEQRTLKMDKLTSAAMIGT